MVLLVVAMETHNGHTYIHVQKIAQRPLLFR